MSKCGANILFCHPKFLWSFQMIMRGHLNFCMFYKNDSVPLSNRQNLLKDLFAKNLNLPGGIHNFSLFLFPHRGHRGHGTGAMPSPCPCRPSPRAACSPAWLRTPTTLPPSLPYLFPTCGSLTSSSLLSQAPPLTAARFRASPSPGTAPHGSKSIAHSAWSFSPSPPAESGRGRRN